MVVGEPPLSNEECAILSVNPPVPDNLKRSTLEAVVNQVNEEFNDTIITESEISALGVGLVTFISAEIRDLLVRESPHALDDDTTFSFERHDERLNMRLRVFELEAWILFLAFLIDYLTEHYINKAVSLFGKLILWHRPTESKSRVLVSVLKNTCLVPRSLLVTRVNNMGGHGIS